VVGSCEGTHSIYVEVLEPNNKFPRQKNESSCDIPLV